MRASWWLTVPLLLLSVSCANVREFCNNAPCPSFQPSEGPQPLPSLVRPPDTVHPGEVVTLRIHVELNGLPASTLLTWVRRDGARSTTLAETPGRYRFEAASQDFSGDTTLTLRVAPEATPGPLDDGLTLALQRAPAHAGSYGPLAIGLTIAP